MRNWYSGREPRSIAGMTFECIYLSFRTENLHQDRVPSHREHQFLDHFNERQVGMTYLGCYDGVGTKLDSGRKPGERCAGLVIHAFPLRACVTN